MTNQLAFWESDFGDEYTDRNQIDWSARLRAFRHMFAGLSIDRVLEVGCNRGHNLVAISEILSEGEIVGVEPNRYALELARRATTKVGVLYGHSFDLPFKNDYFDLVFTAGVLIHIPLTELTAALSEIHRVSRRYILAIEYFADKETGVHYRGHNNLLWKRDFLGLYQTQFPGLALVKDGDWGASDGFDNVHWWVLEKEPN